ncbi:hypothetical protein HJG60_009441 [Phyllostomus discolor]|uniref:Uncharacterized protein n=1 Tax=Phyllostomus discolor TaxID=89673 RepID=A0A833YIU6_9CHIR|nr:hypothetical protein HJG60_009441 [Phyllostomus discolor]
MSRVATCIGCGPSPVQPPQPAPEDPCAHLATEPADPGAAARCRLRRGVSITLDDQEVGEKGSDSLTVLVPWGCHPLSEGSKRYVGKMLHQSQKTDTVSRWELRRQEDRATALFRRPAAPQAPPPGPTSRGTRNVTASRVGFGALCPVTLPGGLTREESRARPPAVKGIRRPRPSAPAALASKVPPAARSFPRGPSLLALSRCRRCVCSPV